MRALLTFERGMRAVEDLAQAINGWLELDARMRASARAALARTAADRFGWEAVAESVVAAAQGRTARAGAGARAPCRSPARPSLSGAGRDACRGRPVH